MGRALQACTFLLLVFSSAAEAQFGHNAVTVSGIALSDGQNHQRIQHVTVRLCDTGGNLIEQTITLDSGEFTFRGVQRGRYILTLEANGFQSAEIHLDLSYASDKGMTVYMKPIGVETAGVASESAISAHELSMPKVARDLVSSGRQELYLKKDAQRALKDFQQAVADVPDYYEAYREIAMAYLTMDKPDDAQRSFRKAVELSHDTYGDGDVGLGTLLVEKGEVDGGEKALRRGVELNPNSWMGFYELGKLDLNRGRLGLALNSANRAKSLAPNTPIVYRLLANIHIQQKDYSGLLGDLDAYIRLDPNSPAGIRAAEMREEVVKQASNTPPKSKP